MSDKWENEFNRKFETWIDLVSCNNSEDIQKEFKDFIHQLLQVEQERVVRLIEEAKKFGNAYVPATHFIAILDQLIKKVNCEGGE